MIRYLLDTDTLSYLIKRRFPRLDARFANTPDTDYAVSSISYAELLTGLEFVGAAHPIHAATLAFLNTIQILDWPIAAALPYAKIRLLTRKQPLHERDMMIAAHTIAIGATLVTNNTRHFGRIGHPLVPENWLW